MSYQFFKSHVCKYPESVCVEEFGGHWEYCVRCGRTTSIVLNEEYSPDDIVPINVTTWVLQAILRDIKPPGP